MVLDRKKSKRRRKHGRKQQQQQQQQAMNNNRTDAALVQFFLLLIGLVLASSLWISLCMSSSDSTQVVGPLAALRRFHKQRQQQHVGLLGVAVLFRCLLLLFSL